MITAWINSHLLSFIVFAPLVWGLALLVLPERQAPLAKLLGLMGSVGIFVVAAIQLLRMPADPLGQMFAESGWRMSPGQGLELDGLPFHSWKEGNESHMAPCGEIWLNDAQTERLLAAGLTPFQSIQGKDAIRLARLQSIHQPLTALAGRWG